VVGVNSFGIGGSNAHVLLASAASYGLASKPSASGLSFAQNGGGCLPRLLVFSAKHAKALRETVENHQAYRLANPARFGDVAYSLAARREPLLYRAFAVTDGIDDWAPAFAARPAPHEPGRLAFVFSGQGAQWAQMGRALARNVPEFRADLEAMGSVLHTLPDGPEWKLVGQFAIREPLLFSCSRSFIPVHLLT
jgi:acyl transferase domain-containing protein